MGHYGMRPVKDLGTRTLGRGVVPIVVAALLLVGSARTASAYGVDKQGNQSGHNFIMSKAIEYLKQTQSPAAKWPLDTFLPWLRYGSWFADNTYMKCIWDYVTGSKAFRCDAIHHYGNVGNVMTVGSYVIAKTGGFAAPQYAQALFDQALKFWPAGIAPSLAALSKKWAGEVTIPGGKSSNLLNTYLGGFPQCERWTLGTLRTEMMQQGKGAIESVVAAQKEMNSHYQDYCPKWPIWAAKPDASGTPNSKRGKFAKESRENAIRYLGWALHLMQDISVPDNAINFGNYDSEDFEDQMRDMAKSMSFSHLPVRQRADGSHSYKYSRNSVYFPPTLSNMQAISIEMRERAKKISKITPWGIGYLKQVGPAVKEEIMDVAIKLTAAGIEMYLEALMWQFQPLVAVLLSETTPCGSFSTIYPQPTTITLPAGTKYCFELTQIERATICDQLAYECSAQACVKEFTPCSWHPTKTLATRDLGCNDHNHLMCGSCECDVNAVFTERRTSFVPSKCSRHDYYLGHQASCDELADKFKKAALQKWTHVEEEEQSTTADGGRP